MIRVDVYKQGNYPVSSPKLKNRLRNFFIKQGIVSDAEVSVALVGEKRMLDIGRKYSKDNKLHDVLSFEAEERFIYPPENVIHLGEIIVCYPRAFEEAKRENKLIDEKIYELVEHGARHLLGIHHEE